MVILLSTSGMQIIGRECVYYFHDMITEMIKWGFQEGKTLFGFGYDFRQSNRYVLCCTPVLQLYYFSMFSIVTTFGNCCKCSFLYRYSLETLDFSKSSFKMVSFSIKPKSYSSLVSHYDRL